MIAQKSLFLDFVIEGANNVHWPDQKALFNDNTGISCFFSYLIMTLITSVLPENFFEKALKSSGINFILKKI
jgi:hypothetical protein